MKSLQSLQDRFNRPIMFALAYHGIFRGALDCGATMISVEMCLAAANTLADLVPPDGFLPEMMDPRTHQAVADGVKQASGPGTPLVG